MAGIALESVILTWQGWVTVTFLAVPGDHAPFSAPLHSSLLQSSPLPPMGCPARPPHVCNLAASPSLILSTALELVGPTHSMHSVMLFALLSLRCAVQGTFSCARSLQIVQSMAIVALASKEAGHCLLLHCQACDFVVHDLACPGRQQTLLQALSCCLKGLKRVSMLYMRPNGCASVCLNQVFSLHALQ